MKNLVECILNGNLLEAEKLLKASLGEKIIERLEEKKRSLFETIQNVRRVGRMKFIRIRVRKGKVQRRRKVSAVKGYTFRGGKIIRMRPAERLHRRMAARRTKIKLRSKRARILRKRRISMRKRHNLGL